MNDATTLITTRYDLQQGSPECVEGESLTEGGYV